jgi:hypothetical protein
MADIISAKRIKNKERPIDRKVLKFNAILPAFLKF